MNLLLKKEASPRKTQVSQWAKACGGSTRPFWKKAPPKRSRKSLSWRLNKMELKKQEKPIIVLYIIVFGYALLIHLTKKALPLASLVTPVAIALFLIFILHMLNILLRGK